MARMHPAPGTRYLFEGEAYLVRKTLPDGRLLAEDRASGAQSVIDREELRAAWARRQFRFEVLSPNSRRTPDNPLARECVVADLGGLLDRQREEA